MDRTRQDKSGVDRTGQDRIGQDKIRVDRTGQHMSGQDKIRVDRTRDSKYLKSHHFTTQDGSGIGAVRL